MHQTTDFHLLFSQLQTRYPMSSLITELIQCQDGQFVVRALVVMGGTTLATGLAAAPTVELAEDQARLRVLAVLGINHSVEQVSLPQPVPTPVVPPPPLPTNGFTSLPPLPTPTWLEQEFSGTDSSTPSSDYANGGMSLEPALTVEEHYPDEQVDSIADTSSTEEAYYATEVNGASPPLPASSINEEPDDLSYLIAQTDIEMDRIGWSKQKGRDHLKRTYNKSTRQRLDVNELMDFLNYLRALPSPNGL